MKSTAPELIIDLANYSTPISNLFQQPKNVRSNNNICFHRSSLMLLKRNDLLVELKY